jgi:hypothetical protein
VGSIWGIGSPRESVPRPQNGKPKYGRGRRALRGYAADEMRAMFLIYLTLIAVGLAGFTLVGLLQR